MPTVITVGTITVRRKLTQRVLIAGEEQKLIRVLIPLIILLGVPMAYAEEFQDYINFPIPDNVKQTEIKKEITRMDSTMFEFQVTYRFTADQVEDWYEEIQEEAELLLTPKVEEVIEEVEEPVTAATRPRILFAEEEKLFEKYAADASRCLTDPPEDYEGKDYCYDLAELATCQRGVGSATGIQMQGRFITSSSDDFLQSNDRPEYTPFNYEWNYRDLKLAKEECLAQKLQLEPNILGRWYADRAAWFGYVAPLHGDIAIVDPDKWSRVPNQSDFILDKRDFFNTNQDAFNLMCESQSVTDVFQGLYGCPDKKVRTPDTYPPTEMKQYTNYSSMRAYNDYLADPSSNLDRIMEENEKRFFMERSIGGE